MVELVKIEFPDGIPTFDDARLLGKKLQEQLGPWKEFRFLRVENVPAYTTKPATRDNYWRIYGGLRAAGLAFDYLSMSNEPFNENHVANAKRVLIFDLDGTIVETKWTGRGFEVIGPYDERIKIINRLYDEGNLILIYTARSSVFYKETYELLKEAGVKFDGVVFDKLYGSLYIDDGVVVHPKALERLL